jgi:peptidoglycan/LPS O-acetylase OafA/YrhL
MKLPYIKPLDGLRTIAVLMVIVSHFFSIDSFPDYFKWLHRATQFGSSGVSLFFVLSGFVITRILLQSVQNEHYFKSFYMRRVLRIFPLYYFALFCYYVIPYIAPLLKLHIGVQYPIGQNVVYFVAYLQNIAITFNWNSAGPIHFWSLAVEEHFYLVWPAIVFFIYPSSSKRLIYLIFILIATAFILRFFMLKHGYNIDYFTPVRIDQLLLGSFLAILERKGLLTRSFSKYYIVTLSIGIVFFIFCIFQNAFYVDLYKHNALGLIYFGLIALTIVYAEKSLLSSFLNLSFMQYIGKISYGMYVWHPLVLVTINKLYPTPSVLLNFVLVLTLTTAVSALSFKFLETPFLKLKKYFAYK